MDSVELMYLNFEVASLLAFQNIAFLRKFDEKKNAIVIGNAA